MDRQSPVDCFFFAKYSIDAIAYLLLCFLVLTLKKVSQLE